MNTVNKFKVLLDFEKGDIKLSDATDTLGARCASDVMRSLVAYRAHLPYLVDKAELLAMQHHSASDRRAIVQEIADRLEVSPRQVNRMMKATNVTTPSPYKVILRQVRHMDAVEKWKTRFTCALSVISGHDTMERAAEIAEVSARQMYRWVNKLLETQEIRLKDLKRMQMYRRKEVADQIELTQGEYFELHINSRGSSAEVGGEGERVECPA